MGLSPKLLSPGTTVAALCQALIALAGIFRPQPGNRPARARRVAVASDRTQVEFQRSGPGRFDRMLDGVNRLPRPMLASGALGFFIYALADPFGFTVRMIALDHVPEPLWWLIGAIVSFYFGAREAHYFRTRPEPSLDGAAAAPAEGDPNPALVELQASRAAKG